MSRQWLLRITGIVGIIALVAAILTSTVVKFEVRGTATCPAGLPPAGFYVHGAGFTDDGFATDWQADDQDPNTAMFAYHVSWPWLGWTVDVGCGPDPAERGGWLTNNTSQPIHSTSARLNCTDVPPGPYPTKQRGYCGRLP